MKHTNLLKSPIQINEEIFEGTHLGLLANGSATDWYAYENGEKGELLGKKLEVVILEDNLDKVFSNYEKNSNRFEKFSVKVRTEFLQFLNDVVDGTRIKIFDIEKATFWGSNGRNDKLSIVAKVVSEDSYKKALAKQQEGAQ